jgi:hypothetical protein
MPVSDMDLDDAGIELMQLYKALRSTPDPKLQSAIKARIDALVEQAKEQFKPTVVGRAHPSDKLDA